MYNAKFGTTKYRDAPVRQWDGNPNCFFCLPQR